MENIADGGAALTAYAKLQYVDMTTKERDEITKDLNIANWIPWRWL
jgi:hypothetical protein